MLGQLCIWLTCGQFRGEVRDTYRHGPVSLLCFHTIGAWSVLFVGPIPPLMWSWSAHFFASRVEFTSGHTCLEGGRPMLLYGRHPGQNVARAIVVEHLLSVSWSEVIAKVEQR